MNSFFMVDTDMYIRFLENRIKELELDLEIATKHVGKPTPAIQYEKSKTKHLSSDQRIEYTTKIYKEISQYDELSMSEITKMFVPEITKGQVKYIVDKLVSDDRLRVEKKPHGSSFRLYYVAKWRDKCDKVPLQ